jgi:hypothetical protein
MVSLSFSAQADEGMWLLSLLDGYTIQDMQSKGFKLTAEDIYSVNKACLKDAVVIFGGGCTGEMISPDGLLLTNHHCGYGAIQRHSSVENDYLTDGFWAMSREEELPNQGLSVQFLRYMEDVTDRVMKGTGETVSQKEQDAIIASNIGEITREASEGGSYEARVSPMFYGNQFFLFVYERFNDVRLVGAPPSSIGNFGEDNDNWMWPRHTGDFSIFRVYADKDNGPAAYSPDNVPYSPKKFFEISMDGIEKGDFTMILGYPGSTQQFLYSRALHFLMATSMPLRVDLRTQRMEIMDKYMKQSDVVRIQYASKYRGVTNAWKKWQGAIKGLERLDAVEKKLAFEKEFSEWVSASAARMEQYGTLLQGFEEIYAATEELEVINDLMGEAVFAVELMRTASAIQGAVTDTVPAELIRPRVDGYYKDLYIPIDREMFGTMMRNYYERSDAAYHPAFFETVEGKYNGDFEAYAEMVYGKTIFRSPESVHEFLDLYEKKPGKAMKKLDKDPFVEALDQFRLIFGTEVGPQLMVFRQNLDDLYKRWVKAQFEMLPEERFYPDANFTMRLTYGEVEGYQPEDAVKYNYFTSLGGVIEKSRLDQPDYVIPGKLESLYDAKDFGSYGVGGTMPVCFTASNHTSGGNSGSPVIDAHGRLIGINFDRNWHGTMSDEMYDPDMCRNIAVDIRYVLFIIDKFTGAGYLLDELVLVETSDDEPPRVKTPHETLPDGAPVEMMDAAVQE